MEDRFTEALQIPAVLSTIKKIQHDSDEALRVLEGYYTRRQGGSVKALRAAEEAALSDVLANGLEQSLAGIVTYFVAHSAVVLGGVVGGQVAQILISVNSMTAPKSRFVDPGQLFVTISGRANHANISALPAEARECLAYALGRLASATGYRARLEDPLQDEARKGAPPQDDTATLSSEAAAKVRSLLTFKSVARPTQPIHLQT